MGPSPHDVILPSLAINRTQFVCHVSFSFLSEPYVNQPHSSGEKLLHHAMLDGTGLVPAALQHGDLGVHVRKGLIRVESGHPQDVVVS